LRWHFVLRRGAEIVSRFGSWSPFAARLMLTALFGLMIIGWSGTSLPGTETFGKQGPAHSDPALYQAVSKRVAAGENYYVAAAQEQRDRGYPLRPFVTMRLPTLALVTTFVGGEDHARLLLRLLTLAMLLAVAVRLRHTSPKINQWMPPLMLAVLSASVLIQPGLEVWHEPWAAVLIALSLALRRETAWRASLCAGLAACLFRELALPFLLVMAATAAHDRRWRELSGWSAAIGAFVIVLGLHAWQVTTHIPADAVTSPGWSGHAGWPFIVMMTGASSALAIAPKLLIPALLPVALLGWAGVLDATATRVALFLGGMVAAFMLIGRPDNFYWGLLLAPLLPVGLAGAPRALYDLARKAHGRSDAAISLS
jgi:hypothetical protein